MTFIFIYNLGAQSIKVVIIYLYIFEYSMYFRIGAN